MSQNARILAALKRGRKLTPLRAFLQFGTLALHSRIAELRARGHAIKCRMVNKGRIKHGVYSIATRG